MVDAQNVVAQTRNPTHNHIFLPKKMSTSFLDKEAEGAHQR